MPYTMHHHLTDPAEPKSETWRTVAGLIMIAAIYLALSLGASLVMIGIMGMPFAIEVMSGTTPQAMMVLLFSFTLMIAATWMTLRVLHSRGIKTVLGANNGLIANFFRVLVVVALLNVVLSLIPLPGDMALEQQTPVGSWLLLLLPAIVLIMIQVSAEEIVFRGYLQSQLAARFSSPLVWMIIPSVIFGALHFDPETSGANAIYIALWAVFFGIITADLTARSGSLGPAIALHFANNFLALMIVGLPGNLSGLSLYLLPLAPDSPDLVPLIWIDLATMVVMWLAARLAIRR